MPRQKYKFTPEADRLITAIYQQTSKRDGRITKLSKYLGIPRRTVYQRARRLGVYQPRADHIPWTKKEINILSKHAWKTPELIQKYLKKAGYQRSLPSIVLKRKRLRLMSNLEGYSAAQVAEGLGVDPQVVTNWIFKGRLRAEKRNKDAQKSCWYIREENIKEFLIEHIGLIDIRRVEKIWFVDVLVN